MNPELNPFAVLSWIIAPALLTNACTLLILSTANRLARAVDRAQELFADDALHHISASASLHSSINLFFSRVG